MGLDNFINVAIQSTIASEAYGPLATEEGLKALPDYEDRKALVEAAADEYELITPEDPNWMVFGDRQPNVLWVHGKVGDLVNLSLDSLAITGSRAASTYGLHVAEEMTYAALKAGVTPVTGGAFGIDSAVLRACVAKKEKAIVVAPAGLDRLHPHANKELLQQVVEVGGVIVSAYGPGVVPSRTRLNERSRALAEISTRGTAVVEAGPRSGSLTSAARAFELGRRVYAVPGPVTSVASRGPNELIAAGDAQAVPVPEWLTTELQ